MHNHNNISQGTCKYLDFYGDIYISLLPDQQALKLAGYAYLLQEKSTWEIYTTTCISVYQTHKNILFVNTHRSSWSKSLAESDPKSKFVFCV